MRYADPTATDKSISTAVTHALDAAQVTFSVHSAHTVEPALRVHAILLQHLGQQRLVLIPRNHILDLGQLNTLTGENWQALTTFPPAASFYSMDALPAMPALFNMPCLYASSLLAQPMAYIESGVKGVLLGLTAADLKKLLVNAQAMDCSQAVPSKHPNHRPVSDDAQGIEQAVITLTSRRIHKRLEETLEIPVLSDTAKKVLRLRTDPLAGVDELAAIVETDPPLAAQVISWAVSPYYAAPGKIRSVEDAIVRVLGFDLVINLALGLSLGKSLPLPKDRPLHRTPYWHQAIYTAALIEGLARAMPINNKPENGLVYLAGLLHNLGFALLAHTFPSYFSLVCRSLEVNLHLSHSVIEQHILGTTREQMGAWLMQCWHIPEELVYALRYQDDPSYQGAHAHYPNLNFLAQRLLAQQGIGYTHDSNIPDSLYQRLDISADSAQQALQRVLDAELALQELVKQFSK
ncbi:HDOD domain-containing protein [Pseudomonas sp. C27(2019)]|uniref:HDOD domain-containing protein n=1 Tax=Pseudomonas sp. C27(2019) TaxID=2604941 RepID=UPI001244DE59|nr:HDOD domain-containing protein [Pseudomonas sp. C27(2019)]QEY59933.1 HDOD domain-containing protein [Pseudomonas sp. C27(2019)]